MEIIIGLIVIGVVGYFVFFRKPEERVAEVAPYKVEAAPTAQAEVNAVADQAVQAVVESIAPAKKPAAKKTAAKKPAAKKTTAAKATVSKKPRTKKTTK